MNPLQRRGLALLDRGAAVGAVIAEQFVRQALVALLAGIRRPAAVVETAWRDAQAGTGLLAGFAGAGGVDRLAGLLRGADLLRPGRTGLRRTQVVIRRNGQRRSRLDGEFVGPDPVQADRLAEIVAPRQQQGRGAQSNRK